MKMSLFSMGILLGFILFGCNKLNGGRIIDKNYTPEHYVDYVSYQPGVYNTSIPVYNHIYYPPDYQLLIEGESNGKLLREWHSVSEYSYNHYTVGESIILNK